MRGKRESDWYVTRQRDEFPFTSWIVATAVTLKLQIKLQDDRVTLGSGGGEWNFVRQTSTVRRIEFSRGDSLEKNANISVAICLAAFERARNPLRGNPRTREPDVCVEAKAKRLSRLPPFECWLNIARLVHGWISTRFVVYRRKCYPRRRNDFQPRSRIHFVSSSWKRVIRSVDFQLDGTISNDEQSGMIYSMSEGKWLLEFVER